MTRHKIWNKDTGRWVLKTGRNGRKIEGRNMDGSKKKKPTKKPTQSSTPKKKKANVNVCPGAPKRPSAPIKKSAQGNDRPSARFMYDRGCTGPVFYDNKWHYMAMDCLGRPSYKAF